MQRVKVLKSGKFRFVKNKPGRKSPKRKSRASKPKRRSRAKPAKGGRKMGRIGSVHIAATVGLLMGLVTPFFAAGGMEAVRAGRISGILDSYLKAWTGFSRDGSWQFGRTRLGLLPAAVGVGASLLASKVGLNRAIASRTRGVPLLNHVRI